MTMCNGRKVFGAFKAKVFLFLTGFAYANVVSAAMTTSVTSAIQLNPDPARYYDSSKPVCVYLAYANSDGGQTMPLAVRIISIPDGTSDQSKFCSDRRASVKSALLGNAPEISVPVAKATCSQAKSDLMLDIDRVKTSSAYTTYASNIQTQNCSAAKVSSVEDTFKNADDYKYFLGMRDIHHRTCDDEKATWGAFKTGGVFVMIRAGKPGNYTTST